jgi:hypothetical protein
MTALQGCDSAFADTSPDLVRNASQSHFSDSLLLRGEPLCEREFLVYSHILACALTENDISQ